MVIGGERTSVQTPILRYAQEAGWTYLPPDEARRLRRGDGGLVLHDILIQQLQRLNPGIIDHAHADEIVRRLARVMPTIEGNLEAWEYLRGRRTVFVEDEQRERNIRLLDPLTVAANTFHVTEEFRFDNGTPPAIRPDIIFLINGIPVVIIEAKAVTRLEGIAEALDQIRRYEQQGPELLALLQLFGLTHLIQFYYGATWSYSRRTLFNWRDEQAGDFETLVKSFVSPPRILRVITDFILFTRTDGELAKVVLRPHQMRAVERVTQRVRDHRQRRGLVWHTQGSGKTYTMITVAKHVIENPVFANPTVLMLVDRNELEEQLFGTLESVQSGQTEVALSKRHLRELLQTDRRGLIVSTIHKFEGMPEAINRRDNIIVLVDEAHRSTGGDLGNYLVGALPNATYVGFTGTPIDRTAYGKGTFKTFGGDDAKGYLDKYSIRESIEDGTTVPLHYSLAPNELRVDREILEREFLDLADLEVVSDVEELNRVLDRAVNLRNMLKNRDRVDQVAQHVTKHYRETVEPMGYKAFLVGVDREACALYKEALDRYLPPEYSAVVISHGHNDPPVLSRYHLDEDAEKAVRKAFRKPDSLPRLLIVTEKLLTGFDAPILYCLYLDKPMRDHVLLQAIARVNRPYEDGEGRRKAAGFVLDFVGIFDKLEKALAFDSRDVAGVVEGLEVLNERFAVLMARGREDYLTLVVGLVADKADEAVLEYFRDRERRDDLYRYFEELEEVYEILSPDPFLRPYLQDYEAITRLYRLVRASYEPTLDVDRTFLRKTAELVQQYTSTAAIGSMADVRVLNHATLDWMGQAETPPTVRVFNLIKTLAEIVAADGGTQPFLIPISERAEQIAEAFKNRQVSTEDALRELEGLLTERQQAETSRQERDLSPAAFAIYWLLQREGVTGAENAGRAAADAFERHPYWQRSPEQEREVRKALYKVLLEMGVERVVEMADRIMTMLARSRA